MIAGMFKFADIYIEMVAECVINKIRGRRETIFMEFCSRITEYFSWYQSHS